MEVSVRRALSGDEVTKVHLDANERVSSLQRIVAQELGISLTAVLLLLEGHILEGSETLAAVGITHGTIVSVMCRRGGLIISSAHDKFAKVWDVDSGQNVLAIQEKHRVNYAAVSPDGGLIATACDDSTAKLWQAKEGECIRTLAGHDAAVMSVAFSLDGKSLVTASRDGTARVWKTSTGECSLLLAGHRQALRPAVFSESGDLIATGSEDCTAKIWQVSDGVVKMTLTGHTDAVFAVAFSPAEDLVATGSFDGRVILWSLETGKCRRTMVPHRAESVCSLAFSPDGSSLMTCSPFDREVIVWDAHKGEKKIALHQPSMPSSAAFLPDGRTVVTGSCLGLVHVWSVASGECSQTIRGHKGLVTSLGFAGM